MFGVSTHKPAVFALAVSRQNCYAARAWRDSGGRKKKCTEYKQWRENRLSRDLHACPSVLLQHVHSFRGGGLVEAPHVVVHLREALLHVILGAALPYRPETEAQGGMVQLKGGSDT